MKRPPRNRYTRKHWSLRDGFHVPTICLPVDGASTFGRSVCKLLWPLAPFSKNSKSLYVTLPAITQATSEAACQSVQKQQHAPSRSLSASKKISSTVCCGSHGITSLHTRFRSSNRKNPQPARAERMRVWARIAPCQQRKDVHETSNALKVCRISSSTSRHLRRSTITSVTPARLV